MNRVLGRAASLFVEPPARRSERPRASARPAAPKALVLGAPADAVPFAAALGGGLAARFRGSAGLICAWGRSDAAATPGWAPARRLAAWLAARELPALARGRLAWLDLDGEPDAAAATLRRLLGWLDAPVVTALAGPRAAALDALLDQHDVVVLIRPADRGAEAGDSLERLALAGLESTCARVLSCDPLAPGPPRWLARAGLGRLGRAHPALDGVSEARTETA